MRPLVPGGNHRPAVSQAGVESCQRLWAGAHVGGGEMGRDEWVGRAGRMGEQEPFCSGPLV